MTATTLDIEQVTEFATAVRRALSDLAPDVLDELTDGLEADLADKLADGEPLGDPAAYAAELRAAAGVEPGARPSLGQRMSESLVDLKERLRPLLGIPFVAGVVAFLVALRPVWWVLRAWALFFILSGAAYPRNEVGTAVLVALVVVSVQWGRGRWLPWKWTRGALVVLSVISALVLPLAAGNLNTPLYAWDHYTGDESIPSGVLLNGSQVTNIFAYGADGQPLTDVQLFDQEGDPLNVAAQDTEYFEQVLRSGEYSYLMPNENVAGRKGWNVFPLQASPEAQGWDAGSGPYLADVRPPLASVQPLLGYVAPEADPDGK